MLEVVRWRNGELSEYFSLVKERGATRLNNAGLWWRCPGDVTSSRGQGSPPASLRHTHHNKEPHKAYTRLFIYYNRGAMCAEAIATTE